MSRALSDKEIEQYREELAKLPIGSISRKTIAGKVRYYRQWAEDGRTSSEYLKESEVEGMRRKIERRRELAKLLRPYGIGARPSVRTDVAVKTGRDLRDWADFVSGWDARDVFPDIMKFLRWPAESKVLIVFGLRRTGKTTMLQQAVRALTREEFAKAAYIKVRTGDTLATMDDRLSRLHRRGFRYVFIDEVTLLDDFIDGASLFSDVYAPMGMKIVLSGTDSLGFRMSIDQELFDRAYMLHTSFVPFREYSRLLGIEDIDEYISYGGLLRRGEKNLDDPLANEPDASFRDEESTRRYIDTAIARNIQHSLACCCDGRYFGSLRELYEKNELTNAINRVIEDMNHEFLASVLTRPFKSSDLGIASRQLMTDRDASRRRRLDRMLDKGAVTAELMRYLDIRNSDQLGVKVSDAHAAAIKAYLQRLDLQHGLVFDAGGEHLERAKRPCGEGAHAKGEELPSVHASILLQATMAGGSARSRSSALASWSGQDVPLRQGMPFRSAITSSTLRPTTSLATPCVLPGHPPMNVHAVTTPSCTSYWMAFEHVPCVV